MVLTLCSPAEFLIDDADEFVLWLRPGEQPSIDEKCRRTLNSQSLPFRLVLFDSDLVFVAVDALLKRGDIQAGARGIIVQLIRAGRRRVVIEKIPILPEFPL